MKRYKHILSVLLFLCVSIFCHAQEQERPKVGLVLSGGGAKGFAHIGVLKAIQEAGLEFDYIAGTSMGAIMGGLYAMGYSPELLEQMVSEQNWSELIIDKYPRKYLNIDEKGSDEKFFINIPFTKKGIMLPSGVFEGQEVSLLLSRMCAPAYRIRDFDQLQTPFLCVGTDLDNITPVVIDEGDLAYALRSSMAILGYFSTTQYDGKIISDGGLIDNFPVTDLKERGVDIIVGIDVQSPQLSISKKRRSITADIWHVIDYHSWKAQQESVAATDIYIHPDISNYDMMSFNSWDSLIVKGEEIGQEFLPKLKALADSLNAIEYKPMKPRDLKPMDSIFVEEIEYIGLKSVPTELMNSYKRFKEHEMVSFKDIETWIYMLIGTKYFSKVRYELYPCHKGASLRVFVTESIGQSIGASFHFDTDYKAAINLHGLIRNLFIHGSKLDVCLALGDNLLFSGSFFVNRGMRPSPGLSLDSEIINMYNYENGQRTSMFRFVDISLMPFAKLLYKNYIDVGIGAEIEYSGQRPVVDYAPFTKANNGCVSLVLFSELDTRNSLYFSTSGAYFSVMGKMIKGISNDLKSSGVNWFGNLRWEYSIPMASRFTLRPAVFLTAATPEKSLPLQYKAYFGSVEYSILPGLSPFMGVQNMEYDGNFSYVGRADFQFRVYKQRGFIIATFNAGEINSDFSKLFNIDQCKIGYGLTFAYNSYVGPLSLSVTGTENIKDLGLFLSIGYKL